MRGSAASRAFEAQVRQFSRAVKIVAHPQAKAEPTVSATAVVRRTSIFQDSKQSFRYVKSGSGDRA